MACTATYSYDPRDKLIQEVNGHGATTNYTLDPAGNITRELVTGDGAKDVTFAYAGTQLASVTAAGSTQKYWYDPTGNLDCITLSTGSQANCAVGSGGTYSAQVLADYSYDYLDRMTRYRSFVTNGSTSTKDDTSDYEYDALDRVIEQTESHGASGAPRTTLMTYLGLGRQVSRETQHNGADGTAPLLTTKDYAYDAYGHRISMTNTPNGGSAATSTYGYDVHGSVSLLLADTGTATASYGYRPYGDADDEMTAGDFDPSDRTESAGLLDNPLNAFRYSGKRFDSGSGSIDMGARRFGPDTARFLQRDNFNGATADLGLSLDPLTQNRYALASGNPISFVEWDGHLFFADGGGGGATSPTPDLGDRAVRAIHGGAAGVGEPADAADKSGGDHYDADERGTLTLDLGPNLAGPCVAGAINVPLVIGAQACIVMNAEGLTTGEAALVTTVSPSTQGSTGIGGSLTVGGIVSNSRTYDEVGGWFTNVGASAGKIRAVAGDVSIGPAPDGYIVYAADAGIGKGLVFSPEFQLPAEGHGGATYTDVRHFNMADVPLPVNPWRLTRQLSTLAAWLQ